MRHPAVTAFFGRCTVRFAGADPNIPKEAVLIDPKQQRHISTQGAKAQPDAAQTGTIPAQGGKKKKKHKHSVVGYIFRFIGCVLCLCIMAASVGAVVLSMYIVQVTADDSGTLDLDGLKLNQTTILYDKNGAEYATLSGDNNRIWKSLSDFPKNLQNAVIAVEDKEFWTEPGVNVKRTIGAALNEFMSNRLYGSKQGASTLEQQLIKNLTGDTEQDAMRKVREIFRALGLDKRYSKETILEAYLNTISLTGTLGGMEAGANTYFGKTVSDCTLAECATLASITKNPRNFNPYTNPEMLITRRNHVLALMKQQGLISEADCTAAQSEPLTLAETKASTENSTRTSNNSYFTDAVYAQLKTDLVKAGLAADETEAANMILSDGLRVYCTVDPTLQTAMEKLMVDENDEIFKPLWHEETVDTSIPVDAAITYDEEGLPLNPDGSAIFGEDDIPIYTDDTNTTLKTGKSDDGTTVVFYENVRTQASMATLDYDGNILAVGGGLGTKKVDRGTNRATLPHQTGSTMKPIAAYCRALEYKMITYSTPLSDSPYYSKADHKVLNEDLCRRYGLSLDPYNAANQARDDIWREWPVNYSGPGSGKDVLVYNALEQSLNTIAVWVGSMVGADNLFTFAHDTLNCTYLDPETDADLGPIVLGSQSRGLTSVELAGAYSIFYDGSFTTPHYYTEVDDYQGNLVLDNSKYVTTTQAISPETAVIMNRLLHNVLYDSKGTARGMAPESDVGMEAAAKTGTTSDYKDYTFAGLTPYYVTAVWWGFDKPANMYDLGGKNGKPTQIAWKTLMEQVQAGLPFKAFPTSDNVVEKQFDPGSGSIISSGGLTGYYTEDNLPNNSGTAESTDSQYLQDAQAAANAATGTDSVAGSDAQTAADAQAAIDSATSAAAAG